MYIVCTPIGSRAVFGSCYQWARKPKKYPITASYNVGLTPRHSSNGSNPNSLATILQRFLKGLPCCAHLLPSWR